MKKSAKLRALLKEKDVVRIVGAHDGLTARLVEKNGFEGVWASGLEVSTSYTVPDANILTMTQYLEAASVMNDSIGIPVIADCDTGYGNSNNVIHMVKKFEERGIAAVCIEDKQFPKVNSFIPGRQELAPVAEFVGKIMAAKNAQESPDFMVFARVEALIAGWGMEEALKRARTYVGAGADGIFIHSKAATPGEINEFVEAWDLAAPLVICPTTYPDLSLKEIKERGKIKIVIYANHGIRAEIKAINGVLSDINRTGSTRAVEDRIASMKEVFELQGMPELKEYEKKYLRTGEAVRAVIPAAGDNRNVASFTEILQDTPLAMLDINGKPLLQRNVEVLNNSGVQDVTVVSGYRGEKINLDGIKKVDNPDYANSHVLNSIMGGIGDCRFHGRTLVAYSDIMFDRDLIEKLLKRDEDIVLVIDPSYKTSKFREKDVDLVVTKHPPVHGGRFMNVGRHNQVLRIGKKVPREDAGYEFVGIALFSEKGTETLKERYREIEARCMHGPFHEAASFRKASFTDMLQELIDAGVAVSSLEVNSGWTEIHTFEDYKRVSGLFAHR